jgi:hypothetical protein
MTGPETMRCAVHPDVETALRCGKCGKPICPRCLVQTPVGARCRECARLYKLPTSRVSSVYYLRAAGTALGIAIVIGLVWGIIESYLPFYFFSLILAAGVGYVIGELVSRSVNRKRGPGLAAIAGVAVAVSFGIPYLIDIFKFGFISLDLYRIAFSLVAIGIGIYMAVNRLR